MDTALHHILERVRAAAADATPLRLCGGGSKDFHGLAPQGTPLQLRPLRGILSYEPTELVITARAGTPLHELEAALAEAGQTLAFEPPHFAQGDKMATKRATVGGMVAAGWSGPARASVGAVRDFVLGVEIINGQGQLLRYGGQVMKNVAGYDISRLMAGSWGTLGVITEVSLKVLPQAPAQATLVFAMNEAQALDALNRWGGLPLPLNASGWMQGQLWLRLRGAQAAVQAACQKLGGQRLPDDQADALWHSLREQQHPWFTARSDTDALWRLSVPQTAPPLPLPAQAGAPLIEWHGAQRWVQAPRAMAGEIAAAAQAVGGSATIFRAYSADEETNLAIFNPKNEVLKAVHAQLKRAFDPHGIFNPGRTGL